MTTQELKDYINKVLGNNIRCLLPSYWWKRLLGLLADRVEEVDVKVDALPKGVTIVSSEEELDALELPNGSVASVACEVTGRAHFSDCYQGTMAEADAISLALQNGTIDQFDFSKYNLVKDLVVTLETCEYTHPPYSMLFGKFGQIILMTSNTTRGARIQFVSGAETEEYSFLTSSDSAINESEVERFNTFLEENDCYYFATSLGTSDNSFQDPKMLDAVYSVVTTYPEANTYVKADSWERLAKESDIPEDGLEPYILDFSITDLDGYILSSDGAFTITDISGLVQAVTSGKPLHIKYGDYYVGYYLVNGYIDGAGVLSLEFDYNGNRYGVDADTVGGGADAFITEIGSSSISIDSELSDTSTNPVQNKVIKAELDNKVDVVSGKQLSTEDFTTALKTKLEGLSNYDDTEISNALTSLETQINTLVSGDASSAIESFNEIIAFLNGIEDSESLDSIVASIEQQIASKQDVLVSGTSIKTINGESLLGEGNLEVSVDTSNLATKEELTALTNEMIANEEVHAGAYNDLDSRLKDIGSLISGVAVTKEEFQEGIQSVTNEMIANEEVTATALNDLNTRLNEILTRLNNAGI